MAEHCNSTACLAEVKPWAWFCHHTTNGLTVFCQTTAVTPSNDVVERRASCVRQNINKKCFDHIQGRNWLLGIGPAATLSLSLSLFKRNYYGPALAALGTRPDPVTLPVTLESQYNISDGRAHREYPCISKVLMSSKRWERNNHHKGKKQLRSDINLFIVQTFDHYSRVRRFPDAGMTDQSIWDTSYPKLE